MSNSPSNRIETTFISISKALHEDDGSSMDTDDSNDEARNDSMLVGNSIKATVVDRPQAQADTL